MDQAAIPTFDPQMRDYDSQYLDAGGMRTHFIEAGDGEPLILIHGGGPGADAYGNWYACLPGFATRFRTVAVDMLGFGRTDKPAPGNFEYSQAARTRHMIQFVEALGCGPVNLLGNSMGGLTSMCVASERPDLVNRLVLMGPAGIRPSAPPAALQTLMNYDGTTEGMRAVVDVLTNDDYEVDDALLQYRVTRSLDPETSAAQSAAMAWIKGNGGLWVDEALIARIRHPSLLVGGKNDPIVTPDQIFRLSQLIENSWVHLMPHCGHWVMMEYPGEFVEISTKFLKSYS